jgi:hypothetical protein
VQAVEEGGGAADDVQVAERDRIEGTGDDGDTGHGRTSVSAARLDAPARLWATLADPLVDWFLIGPLLTRRGLGLLLFSGALAYGVATGTTVATAQVLAAAFWRKGPQGSALALTAAVIVGLSGRRTRHLTREEYGWADREVFAGTLPPRGRILLTDTAGVDGRAFTVPQPGGAITVNLGPVAFDQPLARPELLLHELTHVWQIAHQPLRTVWLARAVATQAADLVTHRAYEPPGDGRPFRRLNPEQQATVVERWWAAGYAVPEFLRATPHPAPLFRRVAEFLRNGARWWRTVVTPGQARMGSAGLNGG